jgi:hypothetical protein
MDRKINIIAFLLLMLVGCEKVIDVDLNKAVPKLVIEANLSGTLQMAEVKLSKTVSYFETEPIVNVTDAVVWLKNQHGGQYQLTEDSDGFYRIRNGLFSPGMKYTISVESENEIYMAESILNPTVKIDSLAAVYNDGFTLLSKGYNVNLYFHDPVEIANYYRLKIYVNGKLQNRPGDFIFFDDENINGQFVQLRVRSKTFEKGDTVCYELLSLDKGAYNYFNSLEELISVNPVSAAPANPVTNFSNGALGYFSAWNSDKETIVIRK